MCNASYFLGYLECTYFSILLQIMGVHEKQILCL